MYSYKPNKISFKRWLVNVNGHVGFTMEVPPWFYIANMIKPLDFPFLLLL